MSDFSVSFIPLDQIVESAHNPWHGRDDVTELAESIRKRGVQQPILVRPRCDGMLELVFGHRRTRAAREAGLSEIPARIRELTDEEAVEEQLCENAHRTDVHPIDEGELLQRLIQHHGYSVEQCASRLKMSRSWVYDRLRLADLHDDVKAATYGGEVTAAVATVLATLPRARQPLALKVVSATGGRESYTVAQTRDWVRRAASADLDGVAWALDAKIVTQAGEPLPPCVDCMFHDHAASRCLDLDCYGAKKAVTVEQELRRLRALGARDLTGEDADNAKKWAGWMPAPWVFAFEPMGWNLKHRFEFREGAASLFDVLGERVYALLHVARGREDDVVAVVDEAEAIAALKAAGVAEKSSAAAADDDDQDDDEDDFESDEDEDVEADPQSREDHSTDPGLVPALLAYVRECPRDRPLWLSLAELTLETLADYDWRGCLEVAVSCGYVEPDNTEQVERSDLEEALHAWALGLSEGGLAALVVAGAVYGWEAQNTGTDLLQRIAARFGVDPVQPAVDAEVAA